MERDWKEPHADSLGRAMVLAEDAVAKTREPHLICATINDGALWYNVLSVGTYADLREHRLHRHLAPIVSIQPNGRMEVYPVGEGLRPLIDQDLNRRGNPHVPEV